MFFDEERVRAMVGQPEVTKPIAMRHEDARFDVVNIGPGGIVQCWTIHEAVRTAKNSKASHVMVYERDACVVVFHKMRG